MLFGNGTFGRQLGLEEVTVRRPGRELLLGTESRQHLDLGLPSPRNQFLLFKSPQCLDFTFIWELIFHLISEWTQPDLESRNS